MQLAWDKRNEELVSLISDYTSPDSMRSSLYNDTDPGTFLEIQ